MAKNTSHRCKCGKAAKKQFCFKCGTTKNEYCIQCFSKNCGCKSQSPTPV